MRKLLLPYPGSFLYPLGSHAVSNGSASFLTVQQKFWIVRQVATKLHGVEVGIKLQNCVLCAAGHVKIAGVSERHSAGVLHFHDRAKLEFARRAWESRCKYMIPAADIQGTVVHDKMNRYPAPARCSGPGTCQ